MKGDYIMTTTVTEAAKTIVTPNVEFGGAMKQTSDKKNYWMTTAGTGVSVNFGKGWALEPQVNAAVGKGAAGAGGELIFAKSINNNLKLKAGAGYEYLGFSKTTTSEEYPAAGGEGVYDMDGQPELRNEGSYIYSGTISESKTIKASQNRLYGTLGAEWKRKNLELSGGIELGSKNIKGPVNMSEQNFTGEVCKKSGEYEYIPEIGEYAYRTGSSETAPFTYNNKTIKKENSRMFDGNIGVGVKYDINDKLSLGLSGKKGLTKHSDDYVGVNMTIRLK